MEEKKDKGTLKTGTSGTAECRNRGKTPQIPKDNYW